MAEPHQHLHFDALTANIQAIHHTNQAIRHGLTTLRLSCAENTLLLRQILDILPDSTNPTQPPDEPQVFDEMPTLTITKTEDTVDTEPVISSSMDTELVQEPTALLSDLGRILDDAIDFRCGKTNVWGSFPVYESVKVSIELVVQPLPNELRSGYSFIDCKYPALTFSFDTSRVPCPAMNCYCIVYLSPCAIFEFGSLSLVDDPYDFRLLLMGGVAHDDYMVRSTLGQKLDVYEDLVASTSIWPVFDKNPTGKTNDSLLFRNVSSYECWQTSDFFQSKLFDPSISKLILNANRLIDHRFLVDFVPNDAGILMENGVEFILKEADQKPTLFLGTCIVDFSEKCNGVRSPHNQLMIVYYGDSFGEYVARVTPIYFDPGGYVSHVFLLGFEFDIGLSDIAMWLFKLPFGRSSIVVFQIAWNRNNIADVLQKPEQLARLYSEVLAFKDTVVSIVCEEKKLPKPFLVSMLLILCWMQPHPGFAERLDPGGRSWGILSLIITYCWQLYTLWVLVQLHDAVPGQRYTSYVELAQAAFGEKLGLWLALFPTVYLSAGIATTLILIGGETMTLFFQIVCGPLCSLNPLTTVEWYLVFTSLCIVLSQLPNLTSIAGLSLIVAITAITYCTMVWVLSISQQRPPSISYEPMSLPSSTATVFSVLHALGIVAFAFRGHNLALEIQATLPSTFKPPAHVPVWKGAKIAYFFIALCLFPDAIGGYWAYGNLLPSGGLLGALWVASSCDAIILADKDVFEGSVML